MQIIKIFSLKLSDSANESGNQHCTRLHNDEASNYIASLLWMARILPSLVNGSDTSFRPGPRSHNARLVRIILSKADEFDSDSNLE